MSYILFNYWVKPWLVPPGINFLFIIIGFILYFNFRMTGKIMIFVGVISLWILSLPICVYPIINFLQQQFPPLTDKAFVSTYPNQAIVVLGGGILRKPEYNNANTLSDFTSARIDYAVFLHKKTGLPIVLSGGRQIPSDQSEAQLMANYLFSQYHLKSYLLEEKSMNTLDEARQLATVLKQNKIKNIYLITNALHMPRSALIFRYVGIDITPAPMGYINYGPGYSFISFFPNIDAFHASYYAIHELLGIAVTWIHFHSPMKSIK